MTHVDQRREQAGPPTRKRTARQAVHSSGKREKVEKVASASQAQVEGTATYAIRTDASRQLLYDVDIRFRATSPALSFDSGAVAQDDTRENNQS